MKLSEAQFDFTLAVCHLIKYMYDKGYTVTFGEAYRPPETAKHYAQKGIGIMNSLHTKKLAIDLNLFKCGEYITTTEGHKEFGEWWEAYGKMNNMPLCWGGHFNDGNHYSYQWEGVK